MAWYAAVRQGQSRHREAIRSCERALEQARQWQDRRAEAHALYILGWAYTELGEFHPGDHLSRAADLYADLGDLCGQGLVLNGQGIVAYFRGDWEQAIARYDEARHAYERAGSAVDAARAVANIAEVLSDQGRHEEAEPLLREQLRVSIAAGYQYDIALIHGLLGRNNTRWGRFGEATRDLELARDRFVRTGCVGDVAKIDAWRAELLCLQGTMRPALELADATLESATTEGMVGIDVPLLERVRAESLMSLGEPDGARRAFAASIDAARSRGADYELAVTVDLLERVPELRAHLTDAEELLTIRDKIFAHLGVVATRP
jgi:tetratricopeptide (TPR) repeat protein